MCTMFDMVQVCYAFKTIYLGVVFINNSVCKQKNGLCAWLFSKCSSRISCTNSTAAAECWSKPQKQNPKEAACQPTLHDTWRPNLCTKDQENPRDGIFVHGTCFQGPIFLLAITGSSQEMELKVGWSADNLTK